MRIYDTLKREVVDFEVGPVVKIYTCGITPYDAAHVGHAATYLYYDVLQRRLRDLGHETLCVRNVTDIDEPLFERARSTGVNWRDLGDRETERFSSAMRTLNLLDVYSEPRATQSIPDVLGFIGMVLAGGHAYQAGGSVYFSVDSYEGFGELSQTSRDEMLELSRNNGGNVEDLNKRDPLDFVLWQPSRADEPSWNSLWGPGRPGWHIECSALAMRELGETIDLHGGGSDLIYPHHECERAQSEATTGSEFARHWMHIGLIAYKGEKMSKSLGNLVFVDDLLRDHDPDVVRLAVLANHYRQPWEWRDELLDEATQRLRTWRSAGEGDAALNAVREALDDDLDTPAALEAIDEACASGGVSAAAKLLGLRL
jgi:L-cysteine:1D-myo-inositol 2-amino-2-deoxy-alpha-D-glucopyranoside ligase